MEMDSEYAGGFSRDVRGLCSIDLRLRDVLGPRCFEPLPQNKRAWDEVFGVS